MLASRVSWFSAHTRMTSPVGATVTVAALAIVDMVKGVDRSARISEAKIVAKSGGRSGDWVRPED